VPCKGTFADRASARRAVLVTSGTTFRHLRYRRCLHDRWAPGVAECEASAEDGGNASRSADFLEQGEALGVDFMTAVPPELPPAPKAAVKAPRLTTRGFSLFLTDLQ
jgi:hypothetical protein